MLNPKINEIRKPTKTISGITPVAVMLPPRKCKHGNCIYCPSMNVPQSYTPKSPVVLRLNLWIMMHINRLFQELKHLKL